jgi:WD40 repeat protein
MARGTGLVEDLQVAPDGRTAFSASRDGTIIAWDLSGEQLWERPFGTDGTPRRSRALTSAAHGSRFAVVDARGFAELFESRTLRPLGRIRPAHGKVSGAAIAPDGRTLAITTYDGLDGTVEFWDALTRTPVGEPQPGHAHPAPAVSFSAEGRWLATGDGSSTVRLWDAHRRAPASTALVAVADVSLSPDGRMLAATLQTQNLSGGLQIRSVPDLELIRTVDLPIGTVGRFSPDGQSLIYGDRQGRVWTLDTRTWRPRARPLQSRGTILSADLSPDGRLLATTSSDGTGRLWDVALGRPVGAALSAASGNPIGAAFIRGGTQLAVAHERGGVAWDVRPHTWTRHACAVAGRTLTPSEWNNALPQHDYAPACAPG